MPKRPAETEAQTSRYLAEVQAWIEDSPTRAAQLADAGPGKNRYNLRKGGQLVGQYAIVRRGGALVPERVPAADMDVEDDPADLPRLAAERDQR